MAALTLKIGPVTATVNADDAKAQQVALLYYDAVVVPSWPQGTPLPVTNAEKLQAVAQHLANRMLIVAKSYYETQQRDANLLAERAAADSITLT